MGFNIQSIMSFLNGITNPKQAINVMLNKLPPQQAQMLRMMMSSGQSAQSAILESARKGQINSGQLKQAKDLYQMARRFGYRKIEIPPEIWNEAESLINQSSSGSNGGFTRF